MYPRYTYKYRGYFYMSYNSQVEDNLALSTCYCSIDLKMGMLCLNGWRLLVLRMSN